MLIVEDDQSLSMLLTRVLTRSGEMAVSVPTAEDALVQIEHNTWDALLADVHLPGMTGLDLVAQVRTEDPWLAVLLMSGDPAPGLPDRARDAGADAFLPKPFTPGAFNLAVQQLVGAPRGQQA